MKKTHIWYSSRFWVLLYALITTLLMGIQFFLGILQNNSITFHNTSINEFINGDLNLPITVLSWGWLAIVTLYCGSDRVVDTIKSLKLSVGQMSMGDLSKLRGIILISLLLLILAVFFSFFTDKDYDLEAWASAFVMSILTLVVGNKSVKIASQYGPIDKNKNGVPDECEDSFNKWVREQKRNGIESEYLTFDYFLDDPHNVEWEKKYRPNSVKEIKEERGERD